MGAEGAIRLRSPAGGCDCDHLTCVPMQRVCVLKGRTEFWPKALASNRTLAELI